MLGVLFFGLLVGSLAAPLPQGDDNDGGNPDETPPDDPSPPEEGGGMEDDAMGDVGAEGGDADSDVNQEANEGYEQETDVSPLSHVQGTSLSPLDFQAPPSENGDAQFDKYGPTPPTPLPADASTGPPLSTMSYPSP